MEENVETEDSGQSKTELSVDIAEEEEKTQVNVEVLDDAETVAPEQPVYQIRPQLHEKYFGLFKIISSTIKLHLFKHPYKMFRKQFICLSLSYFFNNF